MNRIKNVIKKIVIIFLIFYIVIASTSSSFARPFDEAAGKFVAEQYEAFINQYGPNSTYDDTKVPAVFVGDVFHVCCTTGPLYAYQNFLGIDLRQYDYSTEARVNLVSLGASEYWDKVSFSEARAGDIVVLDRGPSRAGHVEMIGDNLGNGVLKFLNSGSSDPAMNIKELSSWEFQGCFRLKSTVDVTPTGTLPATTAEREDNLMEDPEDKFYYQGIPNGGFAGTSSPSLDWLFNLLSQLVDFLAGLLTLIIRMVFVGYANILVNIVTNAINDITGEVVETTNTNTQTQHTSDAQSADRLLDNNSNYTPTSTELQPEGDDQITIDKIILGKVPILDVNFFSDMAGGSKLKDDSSLAIMRKNIAQWYYALRNLSIGVMLLILIYLGIRYAISSIASEKAHYKGMLVNWLVGFIIIFFIHYYMILVLNINDVLITWIMDAFQGPSDDTLTEGSIYETVRTKAYEVKLSSGMAGTILYLVLVVLMLKFFYIYMKRMLSIAILTVMAPVMGAVYAFSKINTGKAKPFTRWMKDYTLLVLVQSVHALVYLCFVKVILQLTQESLVGIVLACIVLNFMLKAANIFFDIFGMIGSGGDGSHSTLKSIINSDPRGELLEKIYIGKTIFHGAKKFVGGTYQAGKGLIFGTSLTTKNVKKKAQARAYGLSNISFKNIDAATGRVMLGAKAKPSLTSKIFRRKDGKQLSNDLADRMKEEYGKKIGLTAGVLGDSAKIPLRGVWNAAKIASVIPLAVAGEGSLALSNFASATGSMYSNHAKRKQIRGVRKANEKAQKELKKQQRKAKVAAMSFPKRAAYKVSRAALAVPLTAGKIVTAPLKGVAGTMKDVVSAEQGKIDYVQTKAPAKMHQIRQARELEDKIVNKYNQKLQETITDYKVDNAAQDYSDRKNERFVETMAKTQFNKEVSESIDSIFRVSEKIDKYMENKEDNEKFKAEEKDITNVLDDMKDYMKQNLKNNDATLSDKDIENKINTISTEVKEKFDKQKSTDGTLHRDKLKNILEDVMEKNNADEKVSGFMEDLVKDMKDLQRTDRNYNIHSGGTDDQYMYRHVETGKANLKNVLNSLTYLER